MRRITLNRKNIISLLRTSLARLNTEAVNRNFPESVDICLQLQRPLNDSLNVSIEYNQEVNDVLVIAPYREEVLYRQITISIESALKANQRSYRRALGNSSLIFVERTLIRAFNQNLGKYLRGRRVIVYGTREEIDREASREIRLRNYSFKKGVSNILFSIGLRTEEISVLVSRFETFLETYEERVGEFSSSSALVKTTMSAPLYL